MEGYDFEVLGGFGDALSAGAVDALQFEYNGWNHISRHLLADFYVLLRPLGYTIGKVYPDGVDFKAFALVEENWVGPAVRDGAAPAPGPPPPRRRPVPPLKAVEAPWFPKTG